ncbi:IQ domain-containing protein F5-like [Mesocricetus auratus]|uniref:IQ domain-containing protein F5-like n=1 Tax=Mesocricetus auratus TaxID=10036 RepID=A0ABM2WZR0_MESAU|nr:IQ domain-containing protein F5-like [Mesocricetus auratus]
MVNRCCESGQDKKKKPTQEKEKSKNKKQLKKKQTQVEKTKAAKTGRKLQKRKAMKMKLTHQPKKLPVDMEQASIKIQAWWRGTLVRRALLLAALSAWTIQCWWRQTMARLLEKKLQKVMGYSLRQIHAAVKLQSWVRMWLVRKRYLQKLQDSRNEHCICENNNMVQGCYEITGNKPKLHIDIFFESQICRLSDCILFPIKN